MHIRVLSSSRIWRRLTLFYASSHNNLVPEFKVRDFIDAIFLIERGLEGLGAVGEYRRPGDGVELGSVVIVQIERNESRILERSPRLSLRDGGVDLIRVDGTGALS